MNKLISIFSVRRILECRSLSTKYTADGKELPKNKNIQNRITLISPDNSVTITDLKSAQNLSLRRELKLVKIQDIDSKTKRPVYKLLTNAEYHQEELQKRKEKQEARQNKFIKGEKLLTLSSKIGQHDLMTGVNKMIKLLQKQYEVRVVVAGEGEAAAQQLEKIYSIIEDNVKTLGKLVQKRNKGNDLRFQIVPSRDKSSQTPDSEQSGGDKGPL